MCKDLTDQQIASYRYSANNQSTVELIFAGESTKHFVVDTILVLFALDVSLRRASSVVSNEDLVTY